MILIYTFFDKKKKKVQIDLFVEAGSRDQHRYRLIVECKRKSGTARYIIMKFLTKRCSLQSAYIAHVILFDLNAYAV